MQKDTETGLILPVGNPSAKAIMLLRKLTPLSIAEIKRTVEGRPITGFSDLDEYGIRDNEALLRSVMHAREELGRELPAGHPLEGRDLVALARSERRDDVLFHDGQDYILVHLTWKEHNDPPFPMFRVVEGDVAQFLREDYLEEE